ncbi:MAG: hypothetical protein Kow00121_33660 [Elainellaceae cyanobacterium]
MFTPESLGFIQFQGTTLVTVQSISALAQQLCFCKQEEFTGQLDLMIQHIQAKPASLYFYKGNLIGGSGGVHPYRRWYRQLSRFPTTAIATANCKDDHIRKWSYDPLVTLLMQGKLHQTDVEAIVKGLTTEIFFDLYQEWSKYPNCDMRMKFKYARSVSIKVGRIEISVDEVWTKTLHDWRVWQQTGLESYSPNQAVVIRHIEKLQQQVLSSTYQNLVTMMNGRQPLRDLALKTNKSLLILAKSFLPYMQQGLIELVEVQDLDPFTQSQNFSAARSQLDLLPSNSASAQSAVPLIVYVDDHQEDGQTMNQILSKLGYRCLHIQDPLQALPTLLEQKPVLIFLDLVMPIVNGYEACAQIRRISKFKEIPIIILTSNDGIIDRMRAKIVGSTDFLSKPIHPQKVQTILQKYL